VRIRPDFLFGHTSSHRCYPVGLQNGICTHIADLAAALHRRGICAPCRRFDGFQRNWRTRQEGPRGQNLLVKSIAYDAHHVGLDTTA